MGVWENIIVIKIPDVSNFLRRTPQICLKNHNDTGGNISSQAQEFFGNRCGHPKNHVYLMFFRASIQPYVLGITIVPHLKSLTPYWSPISFIWCQFSTMNKAPYSHNIIHLAPLKVLLKCLHAPFNHLVLNMYNFVTMNLTFMKASNIIHDLALS